MVSFRPKGKITAVTRTHFKPILLAGLFLVFLALPFPTFADSFTGKVVGVTDGDTLKVLRDGKAVKVRLAGIDCPEKKQPFGAKAKKVASDLVFGKTVTVTWKKTDRWGRILGDVATADGRSLNHELVKAGMAWWYRQFAPKDTELERLERVARAEKRGLWADKEPVAPWEWRKAKRK